MPASGPKRLNWKWEELVLACDLVMRSNGRYVDDTDPRAIELSQVLRQMTLHPQEDRLPEFRNPNGVAQKTRNLVQHLPGYTGSASRGSALDREVVERFLAEPEAMHELAESIRAKVAAGEPLGPRAIMIGDHLARTRLELTLVSLNVNHRNQVPALYQPITLLWAFSRARRGEPRLVSWPETRRQVQALFRSYGRDWEGDRVFYPVAALHAAGLWELDADPGQVPSAHGSAVPQRWFDEHQPNGGLAEPVYDLLRESPETLQAAVNVLVQTYFTDADPVMLLSDLGLSDLVVEGGHPGGSWRPGDWTEDENAAIVDDYLAMLAKECAGKPYSEAEHRNALIEAMGGTRSRGSIEMKHQNISAVMLELGLPYIKGYKPLPNIQEALLAEVRRRLETNPERFAELRPQPPSPAEARFAASLRQVAVPETPSEPRGRKVDYGLLQEESKRIGDRGEEFVLNYEKSVLDKQGRTDLAADVLWVAREAGDGLGYDIRSFTLDGRPRYIEVKATKLGVQTPFYITSAELDFARRHQGEYAIYRVFDIDGEAPEFYVLEGDLDTQLAVEPVTYRARPA